MSPAPAQPSKPVAGAQGSDRAAPPRPGSGAPLPPSTLAGFLVAFGAGSVIALVSWQALNGRIRAAEGVTRTMATAIALEPLLSLVKDAETGQRGFLLTGEDKYLAPYSRSLSLLPASLVSLRAQLEGQPQQLERLELLQRLIEQKLEELARTIALEREGQRDAALQIVRSDQGLDLMTRIREVFEQLQAEQATLIASRQESWASEARLAALLTAAGSAILLVLITMASVLTSRDYRARESEVWLRTGLMGLTASMQGDQRLDSLAQNILRFLAGYLDARVGAFLVDGGSGRLSELAGYARSPRGPSATPDGDDVVTQAARDQSLLHLREVPAGHFDVVTASGRSRSAELVIAPAVVDGETQAVLELGFLRRVSAPELELLSRASWSVAMAVCASKQHAQLEALLEETQRQAVALQAREEELKRSSRYKSEFLANTSHELRTPLNSLLILARLLAENRSGNLSEQQVHYAKTIDAAGHDLLGLINELLDLSKIEAGKVELRPGPVELRRVVESLVGVFQPAAQQKGLSLNARVSADAPRTLHTDEQRLGQILKNLLSNAVKFTERGEVLLEAQRASDGRLSISVRDTGIGVPENQQQLIFEAFQQGDGSTQRRYGGTGLGLSISRDLAKLLGGELTLRSTPGRGSTFTLLLPVGAQPAEPVRQVARTEDAAPRPSPPGLELSSAAPQAERLEGQRVLLVDDDVRSVFAMTSVLELAGAEVRIARNGQEALAALAAARPPGPSIDLVLMDIMMPEMDGLTAIRHIRALPEWQGLPIIALTAKAISDTRARCLEAGANDILAKPLDVERLLSAIRQQQAQG